jgi:hypothetical protein
LLLIDHRAASIKPRPARRQDPFFPGIDAMPGS